MKANLQPTDVVDRLIECRLLAQSGRPAHCELCRLSPQLQTFDRRPRRIGEWSEEFDRAAELATRNEPFETGKLIAQIRRKDVAMSTEARRLDEEPSGPHPPTRFQGSRRRDPSARPAPGRVEGYLIGRAISESTLRC